MFERRGDHEEEIYFGSSIHLMDENDDIDDEEWEDEDEDEEDWDDDSEEEDDWDDDDDDDDWDDDDDVDLGGRPRRWH